MIIIDVREPEEFMQSHVDGALNIPLSQISANNATIMTLDHREAITVYCRSGGRAGRAKNMLYALGFSDVTNGINQDTLESSF